MELAVQTPLQKYLTGIAAYDNEFKKWTARAQKIIKRYRDDTRGQTNNEQAKFNILWSNVQTLMPAVYAKMPKADVSRRFGDNDPIGRVASMLLERALDFEIEHYPEFRAAMTDCVKDRFLPGRGTAWVRYEPHVKKQDIPEDGLEVTNDVESEDEAVGPEGQSPSDGQPNTEPMSEAAGQTEAPEEIDYECSPTDYVHWKDFGHLPATARTWGEVTAVYRIVYLDKEAVTERFGPKMAETVEFNSGADSLNSREKKKDNDQAKIYELWDKTKDKAFWFSKNMPDFIDERDDPLELKGFFPCPKPLYATVTSDSLVPVPDFVLYQDQANELDILSDRIDGLIKALKVRGVYDASVPALQRLMTEGDNNSLIPVENWMAFSEKSGLTGAIQLLPLDMIAEALLQAYKAHDQIKAQIYEITGLSDIIRGVTAASETATAQQIKGNYAGLRLGSMKDEVAMFASELLRLMAQIICTKYQPETILKYAAADQLSPQDQQMIPMALQLLQNDPLRSFRIEVDADSLVQLDESQNKQDRNEFLQAFGGFMKEALPVAQASPIMVPVIVELLKFGIGGFKKAKPIEGVLDQALDAMKQQAAQPQPPKPDPEMAKVQAQAQSDQMRAQMDAKLEMPKQQAELAQEQQRMQMESQMEAQRLQMEARMKAQEGIVQAQFDRWKAQLDAATKIEVAQISAKDGIDQAALAASNQTVTTDLSK